MIINIINIIHLFIIIIALIIPFLNTKKYILIKSYYLIVIPVIWAHWYLSMGYCSLTMLDNYINGRNLLHGNGFVNKLLEPIFLFPKNKPYLINNIIWITSILLWLKIVYDFIKDDYYNFKYLIKILRYNLSLA
tara:strand:- start:1272 stop:1673 length:402 start_codon:yes stop_codon:yes gene_type:complete